MEENNSNQKSIITSYTLYKNTIDIKSATINARISLVKLGALTIAIYNAYGFANNMLTHKDLLSECLSSQTNQTNSIINNLANASTNNTITSINIPCANNALTFATNNGLRACFGTGGWLLGFFYANNGPLNKLANKFQKSFFNAFSKNRLKGLSFVVKTELAILAATATSEYFFEKGGNKAISWAFLMPVLVNGAVYQGMIVQNLLQLL